MTDLFSKLEALQGELPDTPYTYKPLTAPQFEELEGQIYRMGPQIDGTPAWPPERMLEWLQQQTPHIRGVTIAIESSSKWLSPSSQTMVPLFRTMSIHQIVDDLVPMNIDQNSIIRCAVTGHTLWIATGSITDRANPDTT